MTLLPQRWGEALLLHLRAAGYDTNPKNLAVLTGAHPNTVNSWYRRAQFPKGMDHIFSAKLAQLLELEGREALKRITLIPPRTSAPIESEPGQVEWADVEAHWIPKDKILGAMLVRGASPETLERFMAEMKAREVETINRKKRAQEEQRKQTEDGAPRSVSETG